MSKDRRIWIKLAVQMPDSLKIAQLSDAAFRAHIEALCYCRDLRTDGVIPRRVALQRWGQEVIDELMSNDPESPSWRPHEIGFEVHDYLEHQESRAEIEAREQQAREAGAKGGAKRAANRRAKRTANPAAQANPQAKALAESESESESESERLSIKTLSSQSSSNRARELSTDSETNQILIEKSRKCGFADTDQVWGFIEVVRDRVDRILEPFEVFNLVDAIANKSKTLVRNRLAYALTAIENDPHEVRQMVDAGIPWETPRLEAV